MWTDQVSIPFKRESVAKAWVRNEQIIEQFSFNSLQTGKCSQSGTHAPVTNSIYRFNSLQTGKCSQREWDEQKNRFIVFLFQFPSNGKVEPKYMYVQSTSGVHSACFNSLQTGKWSQSLFDIYNYLKKLCRFNSLQTGKCSQSVFEKSF